MKNDLVEIQVGDALRKLLEGRKEPVSTVVNMIAERYSGIIERADRGQPYVLNRSMYLKVLREVGHPLSAAEIATFPALCEDWLDRNPDFPQEPMQTAITMLKNFPYDSLVAKVESMERQL